eukprot:Macronucleus_4525.p1 GENE.Macronucleus_4525~~Macronucleus_4525.p1  ORF type:complete len:191 (+),score=54.20 Macronucleus_4525:1-573(+)
MGALGPKPDLIIVFMAIATSLTMSFTTELIGWLVVYRHDSFKKQVAEVTTLQERVEAMQEKMQYSIGTLAVNQQKAKRRQLEVQEEELRAKQSGIMVTKSRGTLLAGVFMMVCMGMLNSWFQGTVAARLPFLPWGMFQGVTHYGIESSDMTLCSITFIFVLSQMSLGQYIKKLASLEGPRVSQPAMKWAQ